MEKIENKLFKKFIDSTLSEDSLSFIQGGLAEPGSESTGDSECTSRGKARDCTDPTTDGIYDTDYTDSQGDGCGSQFTASSSYTNVFTSRSYSLASY